MSNRIPGLEREPFGTEGADSVFIETPPMRDALAMLHEVYRDPKGLGILTGLRGSGRRTVLEQFTSRLEREDISAVVVDGNGMDRLALLRTVLSGIGYELDSVAPDDLASMLRVFLIHQSHAGQPALLAFVNVSGMHPSALEEICRLAGITAGDEYAARIILACDDRLEQIVGAPAMGPVRERISGRCQLRPLDLIETDDYIVRHLRAAGARSHTEFLTDGAITVIWRASSGLPGEIDLMTKEVLENLELPADTEAVGEALQIQPERPAAGHAIAEAVDGEPAADTTTEHSRLVVSLAGRVLDDRRWRSGRVLVGRDPHNDITLPSRYVSRHHALFILEGERAWVADLKSVNGTYVNSRRVGHQMLNHEDIISIGNHRLKYLNPAVRRGDTDADTALTETAVMRSLHELRHLFSVEDGGEDTVVQHPPTGTDDSRKD